MRRERPKLELAAMRCASCHRGSLKQSGTSCLNLPCDCKTVSAATFDQGSRVCRFTISLGDYDFGVY